MSDLAPVRLYLKVPNLRMGGTLDYTLTYAITARDVLAEWGVERDVEVLLAGADPDPDPLAEQLAAAVDARLSPPGP